MLKGGIRNPQRLSTGTGSDFYQKITGIYATLNACRMSLIHECVTGQRRITEADV